MATPPYSGLPLVELAARTRDRRVERALEFIDQSLDRPIRLADVANVAGVERKHFSRLFQRTTGWRCSTLIRLYRLARAQVLIHDCRHAISDVAAEVGWDVRTLERVFRAHAGCTPEEYRNAALAAFNDRLVAPLTDHEPRRSERSANLPRCLPRSA